MVITIKIEATIESNAYLTDLEAIGFWMGAESEKKLYDEREEAGEDIACVSILKMVLPRNGQNQECVRF